MTRHMSMRTYKATVRKAHEAYLALSAAAETAEHSEAMQLASAMDSLRCVVDALRIQVCTKCSPRGYFTKPDDPYTSHGCRHEDVPFCDVRTGEEKTA